MLPEKTKRKENNLKHFVLGAVFFIALFLFFAVDYGLKVAKVNNTLASSDENYSVEAQQMNKTGDWQTTFCGSCTGSLGIENDTNSVLILTQSFGNASNNINFYVANYDPSDDTVVVKINGNNITNQLQISGSGNYKKYTYNSSSNNITSTRIEVLGGNVIIDRLTFTHNFNAVASGSPVTITAGGIVNFTSSVSDSVNGHANSFSWNFGDGGTSTSQNPTHIFNTPGTYNVTLNASDSAGGSDSKSVSIKVNSPPALPPPTNGGGGGGSGGSGSGTTTSKNGSSSNNNYQAPIPPAEDSVTEGGFDLDAETPVAELPVVEVTGLEIDGNFVAKEDLITNQIFTTSKIKVLGTAEPNLDLMVDLFRSDQSARVLIYSIQSNENGEIAFEVGQELMAGSYDLYILPAGDGVTSQDFEPKLKFDVFEKGFEGSVEGAKKSKFWQGVIAVLKAIGLLGAIVIVLGATGFGILWLVSKIKKPLETLIEVKVDASKKTAVADGKDNVELYVHVATISPSGKKELTSGASVSFEITGVENNIKQLDNVTNNDGTAKALLTSTSPGTKLINITIRSGKKTETEKLIVEFKEPNLHSNDPEEMDI